MEMSNPSPEAPIEVKAEVSLESIHSEGWDDGYNDRMFDCQYAVDTPEYEAYCNGYNEGSWNS